MKLLPVVALTALVGLLIAACGDDDGATGPPGTSVASTGVRSGGVNVTLQEYSIITDTESTPAGETIFNVDNIGPDDIHEFAIVRTDLPPDGLPTLDDATVDEAAEGVEVIARTAELAVGESETLTADLQPGAYALVCNVFEAAENEAHYDVGMYASFTVE